MACGILDRIPVRRTAVTLRSLKLTQAHLGRIDNDFVMLLATSSPRSSLTRVKATWMTSLTPRDEYRLPSFKEL